MFYNFFSTLSASWVISKSLRTHYSLRTIFFYPVHYLVTEHSAISTNMDSDITDHQSCLRRILTIQTQKSGLKLTNRYRSLKPSNCTEKYSKMQFLRNVCMTSKRTWLSLYRAIVKRFHIERNFKIVLLLIHSLYL